MCGAALALFGLALGVSTASDVTVYAAASLKDAFTEMSAGYERAHPGTRVRFSFGGSQTLSAQILHGAPADVFASANWKSLMDSGVDRSSARVFALNRLAIVVRKRFSGPTRVAELPKAKRLVIADERVPAGKYTLEFLNRGSKLYGAPWKAQVLSRIVSREADARSVLSKVLLGEADAGIVYVSDARSAVGKVSVVAIPESIGPVAEYPIAPVSASRKAREFVAYTLSAEGQKVLEKHGFLAPKKREPDLALWVSQALGELFAGTVAKGSRRAGSLGAGSTLRR